MPICNSYDYACSGFLSVSLLFIFLAFVSFRAQKAKTYEMVRRKRI